MFGIINQLIKVNKAIVYRRKHTFFLIFPGQNTEKIKEFISHLESLDFQSPFLKNSKTTTAGLYKTENESIPLFWKRNNNKGLKFTLKYLLRPARVFRAAKNALLFQSLNINTPEVYAVGETRKFRCLEFGYLITASCPNMKSIQELFENTNHLEPLLSEFSEYCGTTMARLHSNKVIHGDLKVCNFYYHDGKYGIWDLDSVYVCPFRLPKRQIVSELQHVIASLLNSMEKNKNLHGSSPDAVFLTEMFWNSYKKYMDIKLLSAISLQDILFCVLKRYHREKDKIK